jgi:hypothetical protein
VEGIERTDLCKTSSEFTNICILLIIERLYYKRPILCQASSKILTPHPTGEFVPPAFGAGGGHTGWVERVVVGRGGGSIFWKTPDTALYSTYVSTLWFIPTLSRKLQACSIDTDTQRIERQGDGKVRCSYSCGGEGRFDKIT